MSESKNLIDETEWLTQAAAAETYAISTRTLRRWNLPTRHRGATVLYRRADIEHSIRARAAADQNLDQHDAALGRLRSNGRPPGHDSPGAPGYGGNLLRVLLHQELDHVMKLTWNTVGNAATMGKWAEQYAIDPAVLGAILCEGYVIALGVAGRYLAVDFDKEFEEESGVSVDKFGSIIAGQPVHSIPPPWNVFIEGQELPAGLQAWSSACEKLMQAKLKRKSRTK